MGNPEVTGLCKGLCIVIKTQPTFIANKGRLTIGSYCNNPTTAAELTKGTAPKKDTTTTSPKASNTVRLRKLDNEERARLRKEGRCFRCREQGHVAPDCPLGGQSNQPRRQIRVAASTSTTPAEPESAISRIRALYAQFTPAEKEEVVNIAEAEGF